MPYFYDDASQLDIYRLAASEPRQQANDETRVRVLEWPAGAQQGSPAASVSVPVERIAHQSDAALRIILAPLDIPKPETLQIIETLYQNYQLPPCFLTERIQSVTHSFGAREDATGTRCSWFHFLGKDIGVIEDAKGLPIIRDRSPWKSSLSQSDYGWNRAAYYLTWESSADLPAFRVTLLCFGAPPSLCQRFDNLELPFNLQTALMDPYGLFVIVLNDLFIQGDGILWKLAAVFRYMELSTLQNPLAAPDFVGLHNVAKHIIFLKEGSQAMLATLTAMLTEHGRFSHQMTSANPSLSLVVKETHAALEHQRELFRSSFLRITSMDERMRNVINLSFNLVAQRDSRVILNDSRVMKMIAGVTLFFLPITTIATIFGTQFFTFSTPTSGATFHAAPQFWIFWAVVVPITVTMICCGLAYQYWEYGWENRKRTEKEKSNI